MPSNRRDGVRVMVSHQIESIIYAEDSFPYFCHDFIINMGGIKITNHHGSIVMPVSTSAKVCLFHQDGNNLTLNSKVISNLGAYTVIKFNPLDQRQRAKLASMLALQQACLPDEDV